jgi:hypothetical protein
MAPLEDFIALYLMYFLVPLWLLAGFADWLCHRGTDIEHNSGAAESALHLVMLAEMGVPATMALFLEVNALVLTTALVAFVLHEATALWDVSYATSRRRVTPFEQHVHSFLELTPLMALSCLAFLHRDQLQGIWGGGADWELRLKSQPLPAAYIGAVLGAIAVFQVVPYVEELWRGLRARHRFATNTA